MGGGPEVLPRWGPRRNVEKGDEGGDFCHEMLVEMSAFVFITVEMADAEVEMYLKKKEKSHIRARPQ